MNMLAAMAIAAALCIGIGVYPGALYAVLPYPVEYEPYTFTHVVIQLQLLLFAVLAVFFLIRIGMYPAELRATNLDSDWLYRRLGPAVVRSVARAVSGTLAALEMSSRFVARRVFARLYRHHGPEGVLARTWPTGSMALWVMLMLLAYLVLYYV